MMLIYFARKMLVKVADYFANAFDVEIIPPSKELNTAEHASQHFTKQKSDKKTVNKCDAKRPVEQHGGVLSRVVSRSDHSDGKLQQFHSPERHLPLSIGSLHSGTRIGCKA